MPDPIVEHENFSISIGGKEVTGLYPDLAGLEVEMDDELAGMFRLRIAIMQQQDGTWSYLDDKQFAVWKKVTITAGFESGAEELFSGYITHIRPYFDPDPSQCMLEVWGMDASVLMDREEKLKDWPDKKDSDIASEIFRLYSLTPEVENTYIVHDQAISTIIQRETDMQFLRRLALRNGFECYVEGTTKGYFRKPKVDSTPQPVLAMHFGPETNLGRFSIEVNPLTPGKVTMFQMDRTNKETLTTTAEASQLAALGRTNAAGLLPPGMKHGQTYISVNAATGNPEMAALCQGIFHQAEWFVTGKGEINANHYGHVLKPRGIVTIKGVGETYSGIYYVTHVTHSFTTQGYLQSFRVKRNGIMLLGSEDFSAHSGI